MRRLGNRRHTIFWLTVFFIAIHCAAVRALGGAFYRLIRRYWLIVSAAAVLILIATLSLW